MAIIITILRLLHIFGAVAWIGGGMFLISVVIPSVRDAGADGAKFMQAVGRSGRLTRMFTGASSTTFLAGLILYPLLGYPTMMSKGSLPAIILTIGAVFGLLAFLHGIFGAGAVARKSTALAKEIAARNGPPSPEQIQLGQSLAARSAQQAMVSVALGSLALLFMAAAQTI
jgi:hypothetical protein